MTYIGSPNFKTAATVANSWLDYVAPEYARCVAQWVFAREHYTGECVAPWRVPSYLIRKKIGEAVEAYEERVLLADYTPHFGSVVDTFSGMIGQVEPNAKRDFGALGGDPSKAGPETQAGRLWADADGDHNGWLALWQLLATDLVAVHDAWLLVDGGPPSVDGEEPTPHVRIIAAEDVVNWRYESGVLVEALVQDVVDNRGSMHDDPDEKQETQWVEYRTDGWTRWRKERDATAKTEQAVVAKNEDGTDATGTYSYVTRAGQATIPLVRVRLPLRRNVGYLMARKANAIFNKESERDHLLRFACFPIFNVVSNDTLFKKIEERMRLGARILQALPGERGGNHNFAAPDSGPAQVLNATIEAKVTEFYNTAFREYGNSAGRQQRDRVTATEVKQDLATGVAAFLGLLRGKMDNSEAEVLYLLEQTVFPRNKGNWGKAGVERSTDYAPLDMNGEADRLARRYFGANGTVPVGRSGRIAAAVRVAEADGLEVDVDEIGADVDAAAMVVAIDVVTELYPSMPDDMKAEIVAQFAVAYGYGDHDAVKAAALASVKKAAADAAAALKPPAPPPGQAPPPAPGPTA